MQFVRIPEDRVSVLIGGGGSTKRELEKKTKCKIFVSDGEVSVVGEALDEWIAKDIVHAIGRGFTPEKALFLLRDDHMFELIDLGDYANTPNSLGRLRGRIIGDKGRTRRFIERNTGVMISIYGKTVAVIGTFEGVGSAKEALIMLCSGSRHGTVYRFLEKKHSKVD